MSVTFPGDPTPELIRLWPAGFSSEISWAHLAAADEITSMTDSDPHWSRSTVQDILWRFISAVSGVDLETREKVLRDEVAKTIEVFGRKPLRWSVERLVYGMQENCAGTSFGRIRLVGTESRDLDYRSIIPFEEFPKGKLLFAQLETDAVDTTSAVARAGVILDEHLLILNSLAGNAGHDRVRLSQRDYLRPTYSAYRAARKDDSEDLAWTTTGTTERFPLTRDHLDSLLRSKLGQRLSEMLAGAPTEISQRILHGWALGGTAEVDEHPERRFLMFAIALESTVLGGSVKPEITNQLANRVAHLIGTELAERRAVADEVVRLYARRSRIAHAGEYGVSRADAALIRFYCLSALQIFLISPAFTDMVTNKEMEDWFSGRMLEGARHFTPERDWNS